MNYIKEKLKTWQERINFLKAQGKTKEIEAIANEDALIFDYELPNEYSSDYVLYIDISGICESNELERAAEELGIEIGCYRWPDLWWVIF